MLVFKVRDGMVAEVLAAGVDVDWDAVVSRNDWKSFDDAAAIAKGASDLTGDTYVATDSPNTSPRFDVVRVPKVGDEVSYAFNGDYYPDGTVAKVSKDARRVTTSSGKSYWRVKKTGTWRHAWTWSLVPGHISRWNPSF